MYGDESFKVKIIEFAIPKRIPGINSTNFQIVKFFSISKDPIIMSAYK